MITNSMFIQCVVLIVIIVYASECSGVMYVEKGARIEKILNRNNLLRSKFTMTNFYVPVKNEDLTPQPHHPNYSEILKNKSAEKNNQITTENSVYGALVQFYPLTTTEKNYTLNAQNNFTTENYNNITQQNDSSVTTEVVITKAANNYNKSKVTEKPKTNTDGRQYLQQALISLTISRTSQDAKINLTSLKNEIDNSSKEPENSQYSVTNNEIESIIGFTGKTNNDKNFKTHSTYLQNVTKFDNSTKEPKQTPSSVTGNKIESIIGIINYDKDTKINTTNLTKFSEFINSATEPKETQPSEINNEIESITGMINYDEDAETNSTNFTELINFTKQPKQSQSSVTSKEIDSITDKNDDEDLKTNSTNLENVTELNNSTKETKKHIYDKTISQMIIDAFRKFHEEKLYAFEQVTSETLISKKVKETNASKNTTENIVRHSLISNNATGHNTLTRKPKGFFGHGLFALPKVLNFFPVGGERECQPEESAIARAGICLNPYDCRQRGGAAGGDCAHGLGVCCVFEVTCGGVAANNLTYFMSPGFPELWQGDQECSITIEKAFAGIMQLKIDFVHFTIGQPNRLTGECDEDALILGEGKNNFTLCGQNHGQHIYYTLPTVSEKREAGELPTIKSTRLHIRMRGGDMPRLWLLRIAQLPLINSAPNNCLQYFTSNNGTIKTFNFASNGRHLASQEYRACIRRNDGYCAIRYSPCDARSFRIGGNDGQEPSYDDTLLQDQMMEANGTVQDEFEGSGMDPDPETENASPVTRRPPPAKTQPTFWDTIWSYMLPSWLWEQEGDSSRQARSFPLRWSPYLQHYKASPENDDFRYYGYGMFGLGLHGFGRQACGDRITIPCESEYFVSSTSYGPGVCDPHHCGSSFCHGHHQNHCGVETSITPFAVSVHFGPPIEKRSPEDNIGACLRFQQVPCDD